MKSVKPIDVSLISPERRRIAKIFKTQVENAMEELGAGYNVTLQGRFDKTPIRIEVGITSQDGEIP